MNQLPRYADLAGKSVLVTGATRGIGAGVCRALGRQKAHVIVNYRSNIEVAQQLAQEIETAGGQASLIKFDVTNGDEIKEAIKNFTSERGAISALVNNAGIAKDQLLLRLKEEDLAQTIDTNLKGAILVASSLARGFLRAENVSVVNVSSVVGLMGNASQSAYAASKAGLIGFTKSFARELGVKNVRCNAICPGFIETDMTANLSDDAKKSYLDSIPLKRFGDVEEVAQLVCFLLSRASGYITGEVIKIDGGLYI